jgi:hypothetical protein
VIRFHLDEMFSPIIAALARDQGLDITSSHEAGYDGTTDNVQLSLATGEGRCISTENRREFARIAREDLSRGETHAPVLLVPKSLMNAPLPLFVDALVSVARLYPDGLPVGTLVWLTSPSR